MIFRKIPASDSNFISMKNKLNKEIQDFIEFESNISLNKGIQNSGKSDSYGRYLIRLAILTEEAFNTKISSILDLNSFNQIVSLKASYPNEFAKYNLSEARFPNATIKAYQDYFETIYVTQEEKEDAFTHIIEEKVETFKISNQIIIPTGPVKVEEPKHNSNSITYHRNSAFSLKSKMDANWKCEICPDHNTFHINENYPYMEAHHIIPMSKQNNYEYSLDFPANIACLCPNCHKKVHLAVPAEKEEILKILYDKRKNEFAKFGITDITYEKLKSYYGID